MQAEHGEYSRVRPARSAAILTGLGWFLLFIFSALAALYMIGTNDHIYYGLQMRADVLPDSGITREELIRTDHAMARYLRGDGDALFDTAFHSDELDHMRDCFELFRKAEQAAGILLAAGSIFLIMGSGVLGYRGPGACTAAAAALGVPSFALLAWGILDFDSLFMLFHRILFTNELWLMDPETDLMIRICPESMFSTMGVMIAGATVFAVAAVVLLHWLPIISDRRRKNNVRI